MADQFYFGQDMQDLLLACVATHRSEFTVVGPLIKPEYMWGVNAMQVTAAMQEYRESQGLYPGFTTLDSWLHEKLSRDKADVYTEVHEYIQKLRTIDTTEWKWAKEITTKFCKERALIVAIKKAADLVKTDQVPEGGFTKMFDQAMSVGRDLSDLGISLIGSMEHVIAQATDKTWGTKTGYPKLDALWPNGWGPGWLVVPLAPPKSYKSTFCINLALQMAKKGVNDEMCPIYYYACEISAELTALRGYSIVSGLEPKYMYESPEKFIQQTRRGLGKWFGEDDGFYGQILLKGFPAKTASIADIRAHAGAAMEAFGVRPRVIVIDHAETVKVSKSAKDDKASDHRAQADIYTEAKALGQELGCIVIMPDRCNKEAVQQIVPNMTSFQGSFEKAGIVDVALGLCQTDIERVKNVIRYFVFLNRHGIQYSYFQGSVGDDRFSMSVDDEIDFVAAVEKAKDEADKRRGFGGKKKKANAFRHLKDLDMER